MPSVGSAACVTLFSVASLVWPGSQQPARPPDIYFTGTPQPVVKEMLALAHVTADAVVVARRQRPARTKVEERVAARHPDCVAPVSDRPLDARRDASCGLRPDGFVPLDHSSAMTRGGRHGQTWPQ